MTRNNKDFKKPHFVTSDWHLGHSNSIKFDKRPFRNLKHMHEYLLKNFNATVPDNGVTYFLGDMGLCKSEIIYDIISRLNGTKILILGNHDKKMQAMYKLGFDAVMNMASVIISGSLVTMTHCPLKGIWREHCELMERGNPNENWHGELKYDQFTLPDFGQYHLHGHIHSPNGGKSTKILDRQYDVGVVANNYKPVSFSTLESWITQNKKN